MAGGEGDAGEDDFGEGEGGEDDLCEGEGSSLEVGEGGKNSAMRDCYGYGRWR